MARKPKTGLHKRKDSPYWYASFVDPRTGKSVKKSTKECEKRKAQCRLAEWRLGLDQSAARPLTVGTIEELLMLYAESLTARNKSGKVPSCLISVMLELGPEPLPLAPASVNLYVRERLKYVKPGTVNQELTMLGAAINWANRELELGLPNPMPGRKPPKSHPRTRYFSQTEVQTLITAAEASQQADYLPDLIRLCLYAGLRVSEAAMLRWQQVDWSRKVITFASDQQKSGRVGETPMNKRVLDLLRQRARVRDIRTDLVLHRDARPLNTIWCAQLFKRMSQAAGVPDATLRDLRRTAGTWLLQAGVALPEISRFLRHADITTTIRTYAHLSPDQVRNAAAMLDRIVPVSSQSGETVG